MEVFDVVGFDNGYDYVKFVTGKGENNRDLFPSVTCKSETSEKSIFDVSHVSKTVNFNKKKMIVNFKGEKYFIGDYAVEQDAKGGRKDYSEVKFNDPAEIAKFLACTALFKEEKEIKIENLVLGLNVKKYNEYRADIISAFQDKNFTHTLSNNDTKNNVIVENVICVPQGIGAYYDQILTIKGEASNDELANSRFALIDIGGKTVDAFISQGREPIVGTDIGINYGITEAFKKVAEEIGDDIPETLISHNYINEKQQVYWKGEYHKFEELIPKAFNELSQQIYQEVVKHWAEQMNRVEFILFCGGGGKFIGDKLAQLFEIEAKTVANPQFSNTRGYYKLGLYNNQKNKSSKEKKKSEK